MQEQDFLNAKLRRRTATELVLKLYAILGGVAAIAGAGYSLFVILDIQLSPEVQIGLVVSMSGVIMMLGSIFGLSYVRSRSERMSLEEASGIMKIALLQEWAEFEAIARSIIDAENKDASFYPTRYLMDQLKLQNVIDEKDFIALQTALDMRNRVAHGRDPYDIELSEVEYVTGTLRDIIARLAENKRPSTEPPLIAPRASTD